MRGSCALGSSAARAAQGPPGVKLYRFVRAAGGAAGRWQLVSSAAAPRFYDARGDGGSGGKGSEYWLEVEAGEWGAGAGHRGGRGRGAEEASVRTAAADDGARSRSGS